MFQGGSVILVLSILQTSTAAAADVSESINSVGMKLFEYTSSTENVMISPYSICSAVAMLRAGAKGSTREQLDSAFGWSDTDDLAEQYGNLINQLNSAGEDLYNLSSANKLYIDNTFSPLDSYSTELSEKFQAEVEKINFSDGDNSASVEEINDWVEEKTNGKIQDLLTSVDPTTRAILINTIYMKGSWLSPFTSVGNDTFYLDKTYATQTEMMQVEEKLDFYRSSDLELIRLPYEGSGLSMIIIKPTARGGLSKLESNTLKYEFSQIQTLLESAQRTKLKLSIPKFKFEAEMDDLDEVLSSYFGVTDVFGGSANLSGISETEDLFVSKIIHQSFINVDENGTEAAAATAVIIEATSFDETEPITVMINQPFMFLIYHEDSETLLFCGRLLHPSAEGGTFYAEENFISSAAHKLFYSIVGVVVAVAYQL